MTKELVNWMITRDNEWSTERQKKESTRKRITTMKYTIRRSRKMREWEKNSHHIWTDNSCELFKNNENYQAQDVRN